MNAYGLLEERFKRIYRLSSAGAILGWDSATMMPEKSGEVRADQLSTLETMAQEMLISPEIVTWLDEAEDGKDKLNNWQQANLKLMRHEWLHATAVDPALTEKLSKEKNMCEHAWRTLRGENNFKEFLPMQKRVLDLVREEAKQKAAVLNCSKYDALLDGYDPGRNSAQIDKLFEKLNAFLPGFLDEVLTHQSKKPPILPLNGPFPVKTQKAVGMEFMRALGFDFESGRLDISHHPFCGGVWGDVRVTTRYDENDFTSALMGVLHETGHALYEFGLPAAWHEQPVGQALGMSMHESQSLLIEMQVCRSRHFLEYATPVLRHHFHGKGPEWSVDNLNRLYSVVEPGLIRVDADEVTYPAHVILRYELEKALIEGDLEFDAVPDLWEKRMKELLGVDVPNDKDGCMQDVHWPGGDFGYFPTYTLGAMNAAQLFDAAKKQDPEIIPGIESGNFAPLTQWLKEKIHSQGSRLSTDELIEQVTGKPLDVAIYQEHLRNRYLG